MNNRNDKLRSLQVKNLRPGLPERGKIKIGKKGAKKKSKGGGEYQVPVKLDHFIITTNERDADNNFVIDADIHALDGIGAKPTEIPVRLLFDDIELNFQTSWACYNGRALFCAGDGETASRLGDDGNRFDVDCTCERAEPGYEPQGERCKLNGNLSVLIDGAGGVGGVWKFRTTSYNSVVGILSSLAFIKTLTGGRLAGIPLMLRVFPKTVVAPGGKTQTVYIVGIFSDLTPEALRTKALEQSKEEAQTKYLISNMEDGVRDVVAEPTQPLPGDEGDDIAEEFYPEATVDVDKETGEVLEPTPVIERIKAATNITDLTLILDDASGMEEGEEKEAARSEYKSKYDKLKGPGRARAAVVEEDPDANLLHEESIQEEPQI
jgi:hypothetical protein